MRFKTAENVRKRLHRMPACILLLVMMLMPVLLMPLKASAASVTLTGGTIRYDYAFQILDLVNQEREKAGEAPLKMDMQLMENSVQRAAETAILFSHTRPDQTTCVSIDDFAYGENIVMASSDSPETLMNLWMNSPGHRANILSPHYRSIGIGCYQNGPNTWAAQLFSPGEPRTAGVRKNNVRKDMKVRTVAENLRLTFGRFSDILLCEGGKMSDQLTVYTVEPETADGMSSKDMQLFFRFIGLPLAPSDFVWKSSNPKAVAVSSNGTIRFAGEGKAVISASLPGTSLKTSITVTCARKSPAQTFQVDLKTKSYIWNGKSRKPAVTVRLNGKTVNKKYYTVKYAANKNVGIASVTVTGKGKYKGYKGTASFEIRLKKGTITSLKSSSKGRLAVKWKKDSQAQYYQLQVSATSDFSSGVRTLKQMKSKALTIKNLVSGKYCYVRVRSVRKVGSSLWYGGWSKVKKCKIK